MMPNLNPKQMQKMMKQLGMSTEQIDAEEVVIFLKNGSEMRISNPQVSRMKVQGQESFQISGDVQENAGSVSLDVSEDDVEMVVSQAGVSEEDAQKALEESGGDIAKAILSLTKN
ncbi:MAG: nascent polypeptide-associated complex protein [archaeon]